jgi:hypothetical protein
MLKAYVGSHKEDTDRSNFIHQVTQNVEQLLTSDRRGSSPIIHTNK